VEASIPRIDWVLGSPRPARAPRPLGAAAGGRVDESAIRARIAPASSGDASAQGELFEAYRADVTRLCQRLLGSREDAEDVVHESFLRMQRGVATYDPARPFRRWLLALAAHCAIDRLRRRRREAQLFDADADLEAHAGGDPPLAGELREELRRRVLAAIDTLPDRYRAPIVLRYYAELDYASIAAILEVDSNQVATLLLRGRRRLRDALAGEGGLP
jgi:RNA polymerase sigma-70 factor (ECF subfamily)